MKNNIYIWQFLPDRDLDEDEHRDLQICICLDNFDDFLYKIKKQKSEILNFSLSIKPENTPIDLAYGVDDMHHEFFSFRKINLKKDQKIEKVEIESEEDILYLNFNDGFIEELEDLYSYVQKSPFVFYSCMLPILFNKESANLVFWADKNGIPVFI